MAVLPTEIFTEVEYCLGHCRNIERKWQLRSMTARTDAERTEAEEHLRTARAWVGVLESSRRHFAGTEVGELIRELYGKNRSFTSIAEEWHYERQTIRRYRDRAVVYAALAACERGLISVDGLDGQPVCRGIRNQRDGGRPKTGGAEEAARTDEDGRAEDGR